MQMLACKTILYTITIRGCGHLETHDRQNWDDDVERGEDNGERGESDGEMGGGE